MTGKSKNEGREEPFPITNPDLRVGINIGMTLKLKRDGKDSYEFIRPEIEIKGIDPGKDIHQQLEVAKEVIDKTWDAVSHMIEIEILKELGMSKDAEMETAEV